MSYQQNQKCSICDTNCVGASVIELSEFDEHFPRVKRCTQCGEIVEPCRKCMDEPCPHCNGELVLKSDSFPDTLFQAVKQGDIAKVRTITDKEYCDFNSLENENGLTLLTLAVMSNDLEMCKFLINEVRLDVCYQSKKFGRTSLIEMMKMRSSNTSMRVMDLLKRSVQYQDNNGCTALMFASRGAGVFGSKRGSTKLISRLISYGADLFARDCNGNTALGWAIENNNMSKQKTNEDVIALLKSEMLKQAAIMEFKKHFDYEFDKAGNFHTKLKN